MKRRETGRRTGRPSHRKRHKYGADDDPHQGSARPLLEATWYPSLAVCRREGGTVLKQLPLPDPQFKGPGLSAEAQEFIGIEQLTGRCVHVWLPVLHNGRRQTQMPVAFPQTIMVVFQR